MAKTMNPSDSTPITAGQIGRVQDLLAAALRKSNLQNASSQEVIEDPVWSKKLIDAYVGVTRQHFEAYQRATESHILQRKPFDPATFIGKGWSIDERVGQRSGNNLDAGKIVRKNYLQKNESSINGEERLRRIKAVSTDVQLDGEDFLALYEEKGQLTLRWLYETQGINWLSFWGLILRRPFGNRFVLFLSRKGDGSWFWNDRWVESDIWFVGFPSAVLAS